LQRVERAVGRQLRQPRIRHTAHADLRMPGQVPEVLAHFRRTGRAVETDQVDAERLQGGERGADLRAEQHCAGGLDRHMHDHREIAARVRQRPFGAERGCFRLQ
jgi:hypothetical protein